MPYEAPYIYIKILPQHIKNQKERMQNLVEIRAGDSVPDEHVEIHLEKAKKFVSVLAWLSLLSDEVLLGMQASEHIADEESSGSVAVATMTKTEERPIELVVFTGSHRVFYAAADTHFLGGTQIDNFREQLKAIAEFHKWIALS